MTEPRRHFNLLSHAWLVSGISVLVLVVLGVLLWSPWDRRAISADRPLVLYCAAGLRRPVAEISSDYQKEFGIQVQVDYANSGELLSSIRTRHGIADADVGDLYLANDILTMRDAQQKYGVVAETIPVAVNYPVIVVSTQTQETLKQQGKKPVTALADLERPEIKVVLANESASIGKMGRRILEPLGIWARLDEERKQGSNRVTHAGTVEQVALDVRMKEGYVGIVWRAIARQYKELEIVTPPELEGISEQAMIGVLTRSKQPMAALQFARYLSARNLGQMVFQKHHFEPVPDADVWPEKGRISVHLAAGAMLQPGVEKAVKEFEQREGVEVKTSYAGCGHLVAQMKTIKGAGKSGKFPDAYLACDTTFMDDVQQWFEKPVLVTHNDIVLIVSKECPVKVTSLSDLKDRSLRIGLGHPTNSALGKLTDDLLKKLGLHGEVYAPDRVKPVVNVDAAHTLVSQMCARALDVAVVYRSNAQSNPANVGNHYEIVEAGVANALARQPYAVAQDSEHRYLMQRLLQAIVAKQNLERMRSLGFRVIYEPKQPAPGRQRAGR